MLVLFTPGGIDAAFLEIAKRGNVDFAVIIHVDIDASMHPSNNGKVRISAGKLVAVGGSRGGVATASCEARKYTPDRRFRRMSESDFREVAFRTPQAVSQQIREIFAEHMIAGSPAT
jgi:hypothetical protein